MADERSTTTIDVRLGQRVRARRLEIDMSQERLADIIGVTFQQVQKYEKGVNRMAGSRLWDIANALEIPVARFFEDIGTRKETKTATRDNTASVLATPEGAQLVALFAAIKSKAMRRRVVELVRALAEGEAA